MKKSTIGIFIGIAVSILAITTIPGLINYLVVPETSSVDSDSLYTRVEVERYDFILPKNNGTNIHTFTIDVEGSEYDATTFVLPTNYNLELSIPGTVGSVNSSGFVNFSVVIWTSNAQHTLNNSLYVNIGAFGLYNLSEATNDGNGKYVCEPTPIYEYVLVE